MFGKKRVVKQYDKESKRPVLRCSICTGEQVAGFRDINTGRFEEVMLVRNDKDLNTFKELYDLKDVSKEY